MKKFIKLLENILVELMSIRLILGEIYKQQEKE